MGTTHRCYSIRVLALGLLVLTCGCKQEQLQRQENSFESTQTLVSHPADPASATDEERTVSEGDSVLVQYVARFADGTIVSRTEDGKVLQLIVGERSVIPGLDQAIKGMRVQETKNLRLDTHSAYGEYKPQLVRTFERSDLPPEIDPVAGMVLRLTDSEGRQIAGTVTTVEETSIGIDLNHPLAGKDLFLSVRVVAIQ
jgi:peptidylprolyl isomerase